MYNLITSITEYNNIILFRNKDNMISVNETKLSALVGT
jgi:hypothetical protein